MNPLFQIMPMWTPFLPTNCSKPPTLYSLMQSMVNYDAETKTSTKNLAKQCHEEIFDFEYPLSDNINKEEFECLILNHFIMRRIGYETFTAFQIALNVKMNEIMPNYNLLFDALDGWNLFDNGETYERNVVDSRNTSSTTSDSSSTTLNNTSSDSSTSDRRFSETPNNHINEVQSGTYITNYNYDQSTGTASSQSTGTASNAGTSSTTDGGTLKETITRSLDDAKQIDILLKFTQRKQNIYSMIFKDLDVLFYQLD